MWRSLVENSTEYHFYCLKRERDIILFFYWPPDETIYVYQCGSVLPGKRIKI